MKKTVLVLLILLVGCTSAPPQNNENSYQITTIMTSDQVSVPILSYQDEEGDFYFRVLPNATTIHEELDFYNDYSTDWTLVKKPTFK